MCASEMPDGELRPGIDREGLQGLAVPRPRQHWFGPAPGGHQERLRLSTHAALLRGAPSLSLLRGPTGSNDDAGRGQDEAEHRHDDLPHDHRPSSGVTGGGRLAMPCHVRALRKALRDPHIPKYGCDELDYTVDVLSPSRRLNPLSPGYVRHFAQSNRLNLGGELLSSRVTGGARAREEGPEDIRSRTRRRRSASAVI